MASSTSSFKRERSIRVLVLALALVAALAGLNNYSPDNSRREEIAIRDFWQHKVFDLPDHAFTVVVSGDSRVYRGFAPQAVDAAIPGARALNYGFSNGGHNPFIFKQVDRLLAETGPRAVILGITPTSLTPKAQLNAQYDDYFRKGPPGWAQPVEDYVRRVDLRHIKRVLRGQVSKPSNEVYEYRTDGWVRSDWIKRNPESELRNYQAGFDGNRVDPRVIADIEKQTRKWTDAGIVVIGYRPPTTPAMVALENAKSGFDEAAFARAFRAAGGIWVEPGADFISYDGSHLTPESTVKLSEILAQTIAKQMK